MTNNPVVHIYPTTTGHKLASTAWPEALMISNTVAREAAYAKLSWPFISLRLENGSAVYRVSTCERGQWRGDLVECWLAPST